MSLWQWSTTPANNATAATNINWAEGQAPSTVNDSARQMMADVATWFQGGAEWLNLGDVPTYVNATTFTVPTNRTSVYTVGRRVRATVSAGTVYGTITASAFSSVTTVTVSIDGSSALDGGLSEVDVHVMNPSTLALTLNSGSTRPLTIIGSDSVGDCIQLTGNGTTTPNKFMRVNSGALQLLNSAYSSVIATLDDAGNFTAAANITAQSDERLKGEWESLGADFIERLSAVKSGTYRRVDMDDEARHAGVSAQSLQALLPEAVLEGSQGLLSVAYGNAALVACVELAKEIVRLRALVESK